jgi:hypothetical protein
LYLRFTSCKVERRVKSRNANDRPSSRMGPRHSNTKGTLL